MSEKSILYRYLIRHSAELPTAFSELREHLASVAEKDGIKVTNEELDELAGKPNTGEGIPDKPNPFPREGNKARISGRKSKR